MLVFLLLLVWARRMVMLQLLGVDCKSEIFGRIQ